MLSARGVVRFRELPALCCRLSVPAAKVWPWLLCGRRSAAHQASRSALIYLNIALQVPNANWVRFAILMFQMSSAVDAAGRCTSMVEGPVRAGKRYLWSPWFLPGRLRKGGCPSRWIQLDRVNAFDVNVKPNHRHDRDPAEHHRGRQGRARTVQCDGGRPNLEGSRKVRRCARVGQLLRASKGNDRQGAEAYLRSTQKKNAAGRDGRSQGRIDHDAGQERREHRVFIASRSRGCRER